MNALMPSRQHIPAMIPPLLSFTAGFIDSFTVLALFGLFVAQVTGSFTLSATRSLPDVAVMPESGVNRRLFVASRFPLLPPVASGRLTLRLPNAMCLPSGGLKNGFSAGELPF